MQNLKKNLAAKCVFSLAMFTKETKPILPSSGQFEGKEFPSFLVDLGVDDRMALVPITEYKGSVGGIRNQLINTVNMVCDAFENDEFNEEE